MIVTGERIQQLCDIYLGYPGDFYSNPVIANQFEKHMNLEELTAPFNNPRYVFCYSHRITVLASKITYFMNDFVLVTHNSDGEVCKCTEVLDILNYFKLEKWYAQNIRFIHEKLSFLPIGIANSQWVHGNLENFAMIDLTKSKTQKTYFNFNVFTNPSKRTPCADKLKDKLTWLSEVSPRNNISRLSEYEFCICPEGNGVDTHRLWEALYVKTIPIVIKSEFTDILLHNNIPLVVLDDWSHFDESKLRYSDYNLDTDSLKQIMTFTNKYINT
jgi:hypothetical protein